MPLQSNLLVVVGKINKIVRRMLTAAGVYAANKTKEESSIPAPRKVVGYGLKGPYAKPRIIRYYRATTPATRGAYPRKLSGRFRASLTYEVVMPRLRIIADSYVRIGTNIPYGGKLERQNHEHVTRILRSYAAEIVQAMNRAMYD